MSQSKMLLRKLFESRDRAKWLALELFVVFVGVYMAFLLQSYTEQQRVKAERERVLASLKEEVEQFRITFPNYAANQRRDVGRWLSALGAGETMEYTEWRYLEPQYNFQVIEYAINLTSAEIIDFELYESLLELYGQIRQLEHAERLMTDLGHEYSPIPPAIPETSETYRLLHAQNLFHFRKFVNFAGDRAANLEHVATISERVVTLINARLSREKQEEIVLGLLREFYPVVDGDTTLIRRTFRERFADFPEDLFESELSKLVEGDQ